MACWFNGHTFQCSVRPVFPLYYSDFTSCLTCPERVDTLDFCHPSCRTCFFTYILYFQLLKKAEQQRDRETNLSFNILSKHFSHITEPSLNTLLFIFLDIFILPLVACIQEWDYWIDNIVAPFVIFFWQRYKVIWCQNLLLSVKCTYLPQSTESENWHRNKNICIVLHIFKKLSLFLRFSEEKNESRLCDEHYKFVSRWIRCFAKYFRWAIYPWHQNLMSTRKNNGIVVFINRDENLFT